MKRIDFIKSSILGFAHLSIANVIVGKKYQAKLCFSTLGCPKWSFDQIVEVARYNGYKGLEFRGIMGELDLTKVPEFATAEAIASSNKKIAEAGLKIIDLGSSANLHFADAGKRSQNIAQAKAFIDLAQKLNCPYVRVFPNDLPKEQDDAQSIALIVSALKELGNYAKAKNVTVLLETHGKVVYKDILLEIMQKARHKNVGLIWDIFNMWSVTKEPPTEVYNTLKKYIKHIHIKDGRWVNEKLEYVLLGEGQAPLEEALGILKNGDFKGYYSFEWEKLWHPEIAEPEVAIPHYVKAIVKYFK